MLFTLKVVLYGTEWKTIRYNWNMVLKHVLHRGNIDAFFVYNVTQVLQKRNKIIWIVIFVLNKKKIVRNNAQHLCLNYNAFSKIVIKNWVDVLGLSSYF